MNIYEANKVISGNWGQVWLEGEFVREATGLKAEVQLDFTDVPMCGTLAKHQKGAGMTCTGSLTMNKINSRMAKLLSDKIKAGKTPVFTIISKLDDPDSDGAERVVLKGVKFSRLTLADWSANNNGTITQEFTFTDWDFLDVIDDTEN